METLLGLCDQLCLRTSSPRRAEAEEVDVCEQPGQVGDGASSSLSRSKVNKVKTNTVVSHYDTFFSVMVLFVIYNIIVVVLV